MDGTYSICGSYEVPAATARRLADCYEVTRDRRQRIVSVKHWDNGKLAAGGFFGDGVATLEVVYKKGLETRQFLDERNHAARSKNGTTSEMLHVDALGHRVSLLNLGPDGTVGPDSDGVAVVLWATDSAGRRTKTWFLNTKAERVPDGDSVWERRYEYANTNFPTAARFYSLAGDPTQDTSGVWATLTSYDSAWNVTSVTNFDADGRPACDHHGVSRTEVQYDSLGYVARFAMYGLTGRPTRYENGFSMIVKRYSPSGRLLEEAYLDSSPDPAASTGLAFSRTRFEYDATGRQTLWTNLDEDGMPAATTKGSLHCGLPTASEITSGA